MTLQSSRALGILELEEGLLPGSTPSTPRPGSMSNPATYGYPIIRETVEGAWADIVIRGDSAFDPACIAAARRLVERGAVAITSNCGFFIRHQAAVAASVNTPVALSSLLLVPMLLRQLPRAAKLAVITADSTHCGEDLLGVDDPADRARVLIGGIEGGKLLRNALMRPPIPTDVADIETEVAACVAQLRAAHPEIAALLFECTGFPYVTPAIRLSTGLPIYDITDLCRLTLASIS
ncbi:hypothetical protein NKH72_33535 [Mesorhizobium sp. M0955]|uniref:hypothetical protein n=1 Tax=unclassified Mesorhizobium TaxID=325217 RepID=UPI00333D7053